MNNERRSRISDIQAWLEEIKADIEAINDEETEAREAMPESLWESERYQSSEAATENLDSAISSIEEAIGYLEESTNA